MSRRGFLIGGLATGAGATIGGPLVWRELAQAAEPGESRSSGFFIQSTYGTKGNFELVVPRLGGGYDAFFRNNDALFPAWVGPGIAHGTFHDVTSVSLTQASNDNFETVRIENGRLWHTYRAAAGLRWQNSQMTGSASELPGPNVSGSVAMVNSAVNPGRLEVVALLAGGGIGHWSRPFGWVYNGSFGSGTYAGVSLIESVFGNLEVAATKGSKVVTFFRNGTTWSGEADVPPTVGLTKGVPSMIQGTRGSLGNFELVAPLLDGGIGWWWRNNDALFYPWQVGGTFGSGDIERVSMIESNYGPAGNNNLEVIALRRDISPPGVPFKEYTVDAYFQDGASFPPAWGGPSRVRTPPSRRFVVERRDCVGIHAASLPDGTDRVLYFGLDDVNGNMNRARVFKPGTGTTTVIASPPHLFCSGHAFDGDGTLTIAGPDNHVHTFDGGANTFAMEAMFEEGRWYPTVTAQPDGKLAVLSGTHGVFDTTKGGGPVNNLYGSVVNLQFERYDPANGDVELVGNVPDPWNSAEAVYEKLDLYPFVFVLGDGRLLVHSRWATRFFNPSNNSWSSALLAQRQVSRSYPGAGSAVMLPLEPNGSGGYQKERILLIGGAGTSDNHADPETLFETTPATNSVELLNLGATSPAWQTVSSMANARVMPDAVLLPDGTVLVVGGSSSGRADQVIAPVFTVERYLPTTGAWETLPSTAVPRLYHSTAVLLADGRVLLGGKDGHTNAIPYKYPEHRTEVYRPPYLDGPRPTISTVSVSGTTASVGFTGGPVTRASLVRYGSATHSFGMDQRHVWLVGSSSSTSGSVSLQLPGDSRITPPGTYHLFILNNGIPSISKRVRRTTAGTWVVP